MKVLAIGATGTIGGIAADALERRDHEVVRASRSTAHIVDITDPESIDNLLAEVGELDAIIVAVGSVPFKPLDGLSRDDYVQAFTSKTLAQIDVVRLALPRLSAGGSITLTSGVLAREPIATGAAAAMANGALESFVITAAAEAPRGIRINAVSPDVLASSPGYHPAFPGHLPVQDDAIAAGYVRSIEGILNGRIITV